MFVPSQLPTDLAIVRGRLHHGHGAATSGRANITKRVQRFLRASTHDMVGPWPDQLFLTGGYGSTTWDASSRTLFAEKLAIVQSSLQNQMLLHHINLAQKAYF